MPLQSFDRIQVPFMGDSMWPLLKSGQELVVTVPREPIQLQASDVGHLFIFKDNKEWVCHRYLGAFNGEHLFKGDFSTVYESWAQPHVLGRVLGIQKNNQFYFFRGGRFTQWLVKLQKACIDQDGKTKKRARYVALILELAAKPLFYSKVEPLNIVRKSLS